MTFRTLTAVALAMGMTLAAAPAVHAADATAIAAPSGVYDLDPTHTSVTWKVSHFGLSNYTARFARTEGSLTFDAAKPENSKVVVTIDPASVRTDYPYKDKKDFDAELAGDKFFNAAAFPKISFTSTKIERTSATTGRITGTLEFMGKSQPLVLDAVLNGALAQHPMRKVGALGFSATTQLKRSDFGVAAFLPAAVVGDTVTVMIEAEFLQQN